MGGARLKRQQLYLAGMANYDDWRPKPSEVIEEEKTPFD